MKLLLILTSVLESVTGVGLMIVPATAAWLLLGGALSVEGAVIGRVAGMALLSLGVACWPTGAVNPSAARGMLVYNVLVACYLLFVGFSSSQVGMLLWPAVILHTVLSLALAREWLKSTRAIPPGHLEKQGVKRL